MTEIWKTIPSFPSYEASTLGRIRRCAGGKGSRIGGILKTYTGEKYPSLRLSQDAKQYTVRVHVLVAEAFKGPCPPGLEVSHLDGNSENPAPDNLIYETRAQNHARKNEHGTGQKGTNHSQSRLTEADVTAIRARASTGEMHYAIATEYGVSRAHISNIVSKKYWPHI